jgi:hypothetical protein
MRFVLACLACSVALLVAGYAWAIEAKKDYTLVLTGEEMVYIAKLLQQQPYIEVVGIIDKIRAQATPPDPPMAEPPHKE